jgi:hypothetical protein
VVTIHKTSFNRQILRSAHRTGFPVCMSEQTAVTFLYVSQNKQRLLSCMYSISEQTAVTFLYVSQNKQRLISCMYLRTNSGYFPVCISEQTAVTFLYVSQNKQRLLSCMYLTTNSGYFPVCISQQTAVTFPCNTDYFFITQSRCVYCAVRTESLNALIVKPKYKP